MVISYLEGEVFAVAKVKLLIVFAVKFGLADLCEVKFAHLRRRQNFTVRRTTSLSKITSLAHKGKLS